MGRRGPGVLPQVEKREQYARLIAQGFNNSEACRIVGINRQGSGAFRDCPLCLHASNATKSHC
jgi:transposase, IS30 family